MKWAPFGVCVTPCTIARFSSRVCGGPSRDGTIRSHETYARSAARQNRSSKYGSGPRYWPLPPASARFMCTSAASSRSAGMATSSSLSAYGERTVRSSGLTSSTPEPSPARIGRNGSRCAAASRPQCSMPSSSSVSSTVPAWRARRKFGSRGIESSDANPVTTRLACPDATSSPTSGPA